MEDRELLPFRLNCEGYFINREGNILAKDGGRGFIIFPGGGVDEGENVLNAMIRESREETGMTPQNVSKLGKLKILWGIDWAKTDKQKIRYPKFKGDEMHFFIGKVSDDEEASTEEDAWIGQKFMKIDEVIQIIESTRPFEDNTKDYRERQLFYLKNLKFLGEGLW